ncbi:hypothetical protein Ddc_23647 [Ditylenchus destructor]|nr:hypothetical protein Ddc_23647 [Ditylenchus destructor]
MHYNSRIVTCFPRFILTSFILWSIFITFYVLREIPLDVGKDNCQLASCVSILKERFVVPQYVKFGIGGLNVVASCYLIFAIKWNKSDKLKNDVVKFTVTMDVFLDVIPTFGSFIYFTIFGFRPTVYVGQSAYLLGYFNVAVCSVYYWLRLTRKTNGSWTKVSKVVQVSTTATLNPLSRNNYSNNDIRTFTTKYKPTKEL